jgi:hypothetical protein
LNQRQSAVKDFAFHAFYCGNSFRVVSAFARYGVTGV